METLLEKPCFYCSESCVGQPRVKDKQGRYAHKACQQAFSKPEPARQRSRRKSRAAARRAAEPDFLADLPDLIPSIYHTVAPCPTCAQRVHPRAVLCTHCGTDLTQHPAPYTASYTASYIEAKPLHEHTIDLLALARQPRPHPVAAPVGLLLGAAIGAGLWIALAPQLGLTPDPTRTLTAALLAAGLILTGHFASRLQAR